MATIFNLDIIQGDENVENGDKNTEIDVNKTEVVAEMNEGVVANGREEEDADEERKKIENEERQGEEKEAEKKMMEQGATLEEEKEALLRSEVVVVERKDYDDDYSKLLQLKQEMVEKEKMRKPWENAKVKKFLKSVGHDKPLVIIVVTLLVVIIAGLIVIYRLHKEDTFYLFKGQHLSVKEESTHFELTNELNKPVLSGEFWKSKSTKKLPYDCSEDEASADDVCLHWRGLTKLSVVRQTWTALELSCYKVSWTRVKGDIDQQDCFDMKGSAWFGGGLVSGGGWPLNKMSFSNQRFVTGYSEREHVFGEVLEKYWVNSRGVGIFVDDSSDIELSINKESNDGEVDEQFCLYSSARSSDLSYTICVAPNMTAIHQNALPLIQRPQSPPKNITSINFTTPIWSSRRFNFSNINQENIQLFAKNISKFDHETFLIENGWEDVIGDLSFDPTKFQDVSGLMETLHNLNFKVFLAVHTYMDPTSAQFQEASQRGHLVKGHDALVPGLTLWSPETHSQRKIVVAALELSPNATEWLTHRLKQLQAKYSIDAFHFTGGSVSALPSHSPFKYVPHGSNHYSKLHCQLASTLGSFIPVETAYMSQNLEIVVKMTRRKSTWDGLKSIIPSAFSLSLAGYNLFIPEAAGGSISTELLDKELYIRWMQLNAFLPFMHYSISPDEFDEETVQIARSLSEFRSSFVTPVIYKFYERIEDLQLLIRPIWWYSPEEIDAINCKDEFVIGKKLLIAPILENGARSRNIYLPHGIWEDKPQDEYHIGPKWIFNYSVPLETFAYFVKK